MAPIKFYTAAGVAHTDVLFGAVLDGATVHAVYPLDKAIDLPSVADTLHKQLIKKYLLKDLDDTNQTIYHNVDTLAAAVGLKGMLAWNDLDDVHNIAEFEAAMLAAYK